MFWELREGGINGAARTFGCGRGRMTGGFVSAGALCVSLTAANAWLLVVDRARRQSERDAVSR